MLLKPQPLVRRNHENDRPYQQCPIRRLGTILSRTCMPALQGTGVPNPSPVRRPGPQFLYPGPPLSLPFVGLPLGGESARNRKFAAGRESRTSVRRKKSRPGAVKDEPDSPLGKAAAISSRGNRRQASTVIEYGTSASRRLAPDSAFRRISLKRFAA